MTGCCGCIQSKMTRLQRMPLSSIADMGFGICVRLNIDVVSAFSCKVGTIWHIKQCNMGRTRTARPNP